MTYYYVYKITCTKGSFKGKYYYGQHTTKNLYDEYKGSGTKLRNYYKKYPNDYIKEIVCFCDNNEELGKKEYEIIHPVLSDPMCLNIVEGGKQSTWIKGKHLSEESKQKISQSLKGKESHFKGKRLSEETKQRISINHSKYWKEKTRSEETKQKISESLKNRKTQQHPLYNKRRIYKDDKHKWVNKEELDKYLKLGWKRKQDE